MKPAKKKRRTGRKFRVGGKKIILNDAVHVRNSPIAPEFCDQEASRTTLLSAFFEAFARFSRRNRNFFPGLGHVVGERRQAWLRLSPLIGSIPSFPEFLLNTNTLRCFVGKLGTSVNPANMGSHSLNPGNSGKSFPTYALTRGHVGETLGGVAPRTLPTFPRLMTGAPSFRWRAAVPPPPYKESIFLHIERRRFRGRSLSCPNGVAMFCRVASGCRVDGKSGVECRLRIESAPRASEDPEGAAPTFFTRSARYALVGRVGIGAQCGQKDFAMPPPAGISPVDSGIGEQKRRGVPLFGRVGS